MKPHTHYTFDQVCDYLTKDMPASTGIFKGEQGLDRAQYFFEQLGSPQDSIPTIHIAGTSGKGSTAYILSHVLHAHGLSVGTHTSPHVYDIRERSMINTKVCTKEQFVQSFEGILPTVLQMVATPHGSPTYFEATNAIAFTLFAQEAVDYSVIETGLGGTYDSTNTITRADKIAVITSLGLDHTEVLGATLPEIAAQKAGIFTQNGLAVVQRPADSAVTEVIEAAARTKGATIIWVEPSAVTTSQSDMHGTTFSYDDGQHQFKDLRLSLVGEHQVHNAAVAISTYLALAARDNLPVSEAKLRTALQSVQLPARFETQQLFKTPVIFDGAHNPQKLTALVASLQKVGVPKATWVIALKKSKDVVEIMKVLKPVAHNIVVTQLMLGSGDFAAQLTMDTKEVIQAAHKAGIKNIEAVPDALEALQVACTMSPPEEPVVVAGSFYLIGELHNRLQEQGLL